MHLEQYTPEAKALVASAQALADERSHLHVEPLHLLARAMEYPSTIGEVFRRAGVNLSDLNAAIEAQLNQLSSSHRKLSYLSSSMLTLLKRAEKEAGAEKVGIEHLLNSLAQEIRGGAAIALQYVGIGPGSLRPHMNALAAAKASPSLPPSSEERVPYTHDLITHSKEGKYDPVFNRDPEVRRLIQILERRKKNHPLLIGEAGVGKSTIIQALATRIAVGEVPLNLASMSLLELDTTGLLAGTKLRGEIEERLKKIIASLPQRKEMILSVPNLESWFGQGVLGGAIGELLRPLLTNNRIRLLGSTTPEGMRKIQNRDPALLRKFSILTIEPPTPDQTTEIVRGVVSRYEAYHRLKISDPAILAAVRLAHRYLQDRVLPDSAFDLLDEAAARKRVEFEGIPAHFDRALRRLASLKAQLASLADDTDIISLKTRERMQAELKELEPTALSLRAQLDSRRGAIAARNALQAEYERVQREIDQVRSEQNLTRLGELEHVIAPDLKRRLEAAEAAVAKESPDASSPFVTKEDVAIILEEWTGIPAAKILEGESEKLLKMEERLSERVIGQQEAVHAVCQATHRGRVGLRDPRKPIGSFLFLGPSGVGKTELAKALAEFLFDDEQSLTRLDMSEFMEKHMAQRLVGAPLGYVDSEEGGFLTEAVRRKPYSVLLFDEVEKAHADVFNLLLQVLDDGRLTDGRGRTADFSNTVVIMTSNIGSGQILETDPELFETAEGRETVHQALQAELHHFFRPEFLNRIDDIILFQPLSKVHLLKITDTQLKRLERLLWDRELHLSMTEAAKQHLVDCSYKPALGARPLQRAILKQVQNLLAEEILAGKYEKGDTLKIDKQGEQITLFKQV
ncbi:chaperone protein ClpB [Pajaroellobacter abortibovis]|uniref:Chaperone protein ClpB n=1 Tax=Pajaroellobacter abortibovis TaxID=1882918 RepID=A0A1L6MZI6_9BACT|nr:chaperone protein ClpB [Pajaroellobacter abortibovis]